MSNSPFIFSPVQATSVVSYYADLPAASLNFATLIFVRNSSGIWLINRREAGFYRSSGTDWLFEGETQVSGNLASQNQVVILYARDAALTTYVGGAVYLNNFGTLINADASTINQSAVIGIVTNKPTNTSADILVAGISPAIYTDLIPGADYFLDPAVLGGLTTMPPTGSGQTVLKVGIALSTTELLLCIKNRLIRAL